MSKWAVCYDQLDVSSLACFEIASRRIQLLEEAYSVNPKAPKFDEEITFRAWASATSPSCRSSQVTLLTLSSQRPLSPRSAVKRGRRPVSRPRVECAWALHSLGCTQLSIRIAVYGAVAR